MKKIKELLLPIGLFLLGIVAVLRYFIAPKKDDTLFPGAEKKKAEQDVEETKKEIEKVADKQYSDEEIDEKFNR
jgi:hypothetical protein